MNILIVESDHDLNLALSDVLKTVNHNVDSVFDGVQALNKVDEKQYDLMIIDVNIPRIQTNEVIDRIKTSYPQIHVLTITNFTEINDYLLNLNLNVSDYITKPFLTKDFFKIIDSIENNMNSDEVITIGKVTVESKDFSMSNLNGKVNLTSRELDCIRLFSNHLEEPVTINQLNECILSNNSYIYVNSLNNKLKRINSDVHIDSLFEKGYAMVKNYG